MLKKPDPLPHIVIPAQAGIHKLQRFRQMREVQSIWIPAYAGMTQVFQRPEG